MSIFGIYVINNIPDYNQEKIVSVNCDARYLSCYCTAWQNSALEYCNNFMKDSMYKIQKINFTK